MTNLSTYLKENLMGGYANGSFTAEQVSIFSVNYLLNGRLTQADFDKIQEMLNPPIIDGSHAMWVPSIGDIFAEDWVIEEEM